MKPIDPNQPTIETRYRTLLMLWFSICMSVVIFFVIVRFIPGPPESNVRLGLILNCLGIVPVGLSFLLKQRLLDRSTAEGKVDGVQSAYVLAFALCEAAALFGVLDHFINGSPYYYLGFVLAALGMLLHFPRKQHLIDASHRQV